MQPTDADRFRNLLRGLGRTFGQEPDALVLDAYWLALSVMSIDDFEAASAHLLRTAKFMPRPAEFLALRAAGRITAGEAWAAVVEHARKGRYRTDKLAPEIEQAVRMIGGWTVIAMSEESRLPFVQRLFAEHFDAHREAEDIRTALPQISSTAPERMLEQKP